MDGGKVDCAECFAPVKPDALCSPECSALHPAEARPVSVDAIMHLNEKDKQARFWPLLAGALFGKVTRDEDKAA